METVATAPGKAILFGEHAVVYKRPAIAVPITEVAARCRISPGEKGQGLIIEAQDLHRVYALADAAGNDPLAAAVRLALAELGHDSEPDLILRLTSTVPMARGLGSGAAVATALIRALTGHLGRPLPPQTLSNLVYQVEKIHHGTPSGIDNTVVAFAQPVYFQQGRPMQRLAVKNPLTLIIGDTGRPSPTKEAVGDLRQRWQADTERYEGYFDEIGVIVEQARLALERGDIPALGRLMDQNQELLGALELSSPELDRLIDASRRAGAMGAKLSGAGWGGNMIALARPDLARAVAQSLYQAGAVKTIITTVA
ncbi:MAG: mevalonate kinase [Anaerolineae bacterium]